MSRALYLFRDKRWRGAGAALLLLVAVFFTWFFIFRGNAANVTPTVAQPPLRPAAGKQISRNVYVAAIEKAITEVHHNDPQEAAKTLLAVEGAGVDAPAPNIAASQVDNTLTITRLSANTPDLPGIERSLRTLLDALNLRGKPLAETLGGEQAQARLREVLSDRAFNYDRDLTPLQKLARWLAGNTGQADPGDTLWQWGLALLAGIFAGVGTYLMLGRVRNRLARLGISALAGLIVAGLFRLGVGELGTTLELLAAIGIVVAAVAAGLLASGMRQASAPARPRSLSELAVALGMGSGQARQRAEEAAAKADYRLAIRYRCLAVLLALDEAGQLGFDRTATNREYLFRAQGSLHDELQPLLDRFSAVWYGGAPAGDEDWHLVDAQAAKVEAISAEASRARRAA